MSSLLLRTQTELSAMTVDACGVFAHQVGGIVMADLL